jgi:streptogramin lyase
MVREYQHHHLKTPIHLLTRPSDGALLVGSRDRNSILALDPESGDVTTLVEPGAGGLAEPSGMAIGPDGKLYVGNRKMQQVLRYDADSGHADPAPFLEKLEDAPEFIALVER